MRASEVFQALSLAGLACYGLTWITFAALYARLDLRPEDVGATVDFLLIRGALLASIFGALIGGFLMPTTAGNWLRRGRDGDMRPFHTVFVLLQTGFISLCLAGAYATLSVVDQTVDIGQSKLSKGAVASAITLVLLFIEGALVLRAIGYKAGHPKGPGLESAVRLKLSVAAVGIWMLVGCLGAWGTGTLLGNRVRAGIQIPAPFFGIFRAEVFYSVPTTPTLSDGPSSSAALPDNRFGLPIDCGLVLGYGDGFVRLFSDWTHRVVSLPVEYARVVRDPAMIGRCKPPGSQP